MMTTKFPVLNPTDGPRETKSRNQSCASYDLLQISVIRRLVMWGGFPYVFQGLMLAVIAWGQYAPAGANQKVYAKTHLATLLIWGIWWPVMIWAAVLMGRAWCAVCPLELVSNASERVGRRLGIRQLHLRRWMISGAVIVVLYALLQFLVAGAHINRVPAYTSWFLIGLLGLAALTGLIFKDRAFCRGFCPVGLLLATYGRGGMLAVRAGSGETCNACTGKDCLMACNRNRGDARSCPSLLNPPRSNSNRDCLVCGQCIKACQPDNMQLLLRRLFPLSDAREPFASWPTTIFVMLASGFVTWELLAEWPKGEEIFMRVPELVNEWQGASSLAGYLHGVWALVIVPLGFWWLIWAVMRLMGDDSSLPTAWRRMALPVAVVVAAGHMAKALAKLASWAGFLPGALLDPAGTETIRALKAGAMTQPAALLPTTAVIVFGIVLIVGGLLYAIREARLAHPESTPHASHLIPKISLAFAFALIVAGWIFK